MGEQIQFSERESKVIELLLTGQSNKQMALGLGVSVRTVEFHLSHIYAKLGVNSRTEAVVRLANRDLLESAETGDGASLRESAVEKSGEVRDNGERPFSTRRLPMKNLLLTGSGLLATVLIAILALANMPVKNTGTTPAPSSSSTAQITPSATPTTPPSTSISSKQYILDQIRQAAAGYEQNVQAEKKSGKMRFSWDTHSGAELFLFQDDSYQRILELRDKLMEKITELDGLYNQVYRDELKPTPFPSQPSTEQEKTSYKAALLEQGEQLCSLEAWQNEPDGEAIQVYDPDTGSYQSVYIGEVLARCEVYGQMLEELRVAPLLEKINQEADKAMIQRVTGKPDLRLTFRSFQPLANAPWLSTALYTDQTGTKYSVDVESARLAAIEPNFPTHPIIAADKTKNIDELRGIAGQFALTNSPRLAELKPVLEYAEGGKTSISFFTWTYRAKDWSGSDWVMMPPFIQVGVLQDGQVVTYINTLDLYK